MFEMPPNAMHETATTQNKASLGARVTFRPNVFSDFSEGRGSAFSSAGFASSAAGGAAVSGAGAAGAAASGAGALGAAG